MADSRDAMPNPGKQLHRRSPELPSLSGGSIYICILQYGADNRVHNAVTVRAEGGILIDTNPH